jgi:hypothetical protein
MLLAAGANGAATAVLLPTVFSIVLKHAFSPQAYLVTTVVPRNSPVRCLPPQLFPA